MSQQITTGDGDPSAVPLDVHIRQRAVSAASTSMKIKRLVWAGVEATLYRLSFHTFNAWRAWLLRLFGARIGANCTIRRTSRVYYPWNLTMGPLACLGDDVTVYNIAPVTLGERATISQEAYICSGTHNYDLLSMPLLLKPIDIGADAWVCARAFVAPGVTVGEGAVLGACSVAMSDVSPWTVVAGNPAQVIRHRERPS